MTWEQFMGIFDPKTVLGAGCGAMVSFISKTLWDMYFSEKTKSTEQLLDRLKNNRIRAFGRQRLRQEAVDALIDWKRRYPPPKSGPKELNILTNEDIVVVRDIRMKYEDSSCPYGEPEVPSTPLFIRLGQKTGAITTEQSSPLVAFEEQIGHLVKELADNFERLAKDLKDTQRLLIEVLPEATLPKLWLLAIDIVVSEKDQALILPHFQRGKVKQPSASVVDIVARTLRG